LSLFWKGFKKQRLKVLEMKTFPFQSVIKGECKG
jgi:hypothetical protein